MSWCTTAAPSPGLGGQAERLGLNRQFDPVRVTEPSAHHAVQYSNAASSSEYRCDHVSASEV
jgi:hypothetical protein